MQGIAVLVLIVVAALSLPVEARLWRSGRLSDRAMSILLLGRLPVAVFLSGMIQGHAPVVTLAATVLVLIPAAHFHRTVHDLLRQEWTQNG